MITIEEYSQVRLLSEAEWNNIVSYVPNVPVEKEQKWWLNTYWADGKVMAVTEDGSVKPMDADCALWCRPLFIFYTFFDLKQGDKIKVINKECTVVNVFNNVVGGAKVFALCDEVLTDDAYYKFSNTYLNSEKFKKLL